MTSTEVDCLYFSEAPAQLISATMQGTTQTPRTAGSPAVAYQCQGLVPYSAAPPAAEAEDVEREGVRLGGRKYPLPEHQKIGHTRETGARHGTRNPAPGSGPRRGQENPTQPLP